VEKRYSPKRGSLPGSLKGVGFYFSIFSCWDDSIKEWVVDHNTLFDRFAKRAARTTGHPASFAAAVLIILGWAISGPIFGFSNTWQVVINTGTTIITFLMVFLIQNTQNRDGAAVQLKLDKLIRTIDGANNAFLDLQELSEEDLARIRARFEALARESRENLRQRVLGILELPSCKPIEHALRDSWSVPGGAGCPENKR
jgi:low affinity Fe/Cu permease